MASFNSITVVGRLGKDPEITNTQSGKQRLEMTLATNHYNPETKKRDRTSWHRITSFSESHVKFAQYLKKGSLVAVQGEQINEVVGEGDSRKTYPKIYAQNIENFTPKDAGDANGSAPAQNQRSSQAPSHKPAAAPAQAAPPPEQVYDDVPF